MEWMMGVRSLSLSTLLPLPHFSLKYQQQLLMRPHSGRVFGLLLPLAFVVIDDR